MRNRVSSYICESLVARANERAGKITLTRHAVDIKPTPTVTAEEILAFSGLS